MGTRTLLFYIWAFFGAFYAQIENDEERWKDEWKKRPIEETQAYHHQNIRIMIRIGEYYTDWKENGTPIPWLKVCGNAFIAWVREQWPEEYSET